MLEFGYYVLFGPVETKKNHCKTTQDNLTYLQEHSLQLNNKNSLRHAITIISLSLKMAEAD